MNHTEHFMMFLCLFFFFFLVIVEIDNLIHFHYMEKSGQDIFLSMFKQKKGNHMGL